MKIPLEKATATHSSIKGFPGSSDSKETVCNVGNPGSIPVSGRSPEGGNSTTTVFLPGEFHGQRSLEGYNQKGCKELDTTE